MAYVVNRGTRDKPKWYAKYKDLDGKWKQVKTGKATKPEALAWARELEVNVSRGVPALQQETPAELEAKKLTVLRLCARFVDEYNRPRIKNMDDYRRQARPVLNRMIKPYSIASLLASEVRRADIERWRGALLAAKYSPYSVNRAWAILSRAYNWASAMEILDCRNPLSRTELMPVRPSDEHYSLSEVHKMLAQAGERAPDLYPMLATALYTGMRKGELSGLTWAAVRLGGDIPRIEVKTSYDTGSTKSGEPRAVPIHPELLPILRAWKDRCPTPEGLAFPVRVTIKGARVLRMGKTSDMHGLPELLDSIEGCHRPKESTALPGRNRKDRAWHALRHTFATHFLEASGNGDALSKILGHSVGSGAAMITAGYTHTSMDYLRREIVKMTLQPPTPAGVVSFQDEQRRRLAEK